MTSFHAPVADILFILEHVAGASRLPGWDADLAREIVTQFARFAQAEIAPLDERGDQQGCRMESGRVFMPDGFAAAYSAFSEQGWPSLAVPEAHGGQGMPAPVLGAVTEIFAGASHSFQMVVDLAPGAASVIARFGTEAQKRLWLPRLASGAWLATMALTESGAGSDLSGVRTRAETSAGAWRIAGEKIFISGGDQDLTDRVLHLVLARTGAPDSGTRGLSLFLVPSHDEAGVSASLSVTRIEEKMGLHASPTCQMAFDDAAGELIGAPGDGLKIMFAMMNHMRLGVALQGVAHATRAADIARRYAQERRQGGRLIAGHPDVARMLDEMDMAAIGGRALCQIALVELARKEDPDLVDFLTPVCKVCCTEAGMHAAQLGIQVLGGYGYLREYRVEQVLRDARITAIYEGTNGIHALTLATRLLRNAEGRAADAFVRFVAASPAAHALDPWREARAVLLAAADPGAAAQAFMNLTIEVALAAVWGRLATAVAAAPDPQHLRALAARQEREGPLRRDYWAAMVRLTGAAAG